MGPVLAALLLGAVTVKSEPAAVTLGKDSAAQLEVVAEGADKVTVTASAGTVGSVESVGAGKFKVRYTPPADKHPQVALILAVAEIKGERSLGWYALVLKARATLDIDTKPRAKVTAKVGTETFGPATADAHGHLALPAIVPPGVPTAEITATDRAGNVTVKPLDLRPLQFSRAAAALRSSSASWADPGPSELEVFAIQPDGKPAPDATGLTVSAKSGKLEAAPSRGSGIFVWRYRAPDQVGDGKDAVTVAEEGSPPASTEIAVKPGAPVRIGLDLEPPAYLAGSGTPVKVHARALDAMGNPTGKAVGTFSAEAGSIEGNGSEAVLKAPDAFEGRTQLAVRMKGTVSGEASLQLQAGSVVSGALSLPRGALHTGETVHGKAVLKDRFGNPVEHVPLEASTVDGRPATVREIGGGNYDVDYVSSSSDSPGDLSLVVRSSGTQLAESTATLRPYERPWGISAGVYGGGASNTKLATTFSPRAELELRLGHTELELLLQAEYHALLNFNDGVNKSAGSGGLLDGALGLRYSIPFGLRTAAYLGGGVGVFGASGSLTSTVPGASTSPVRFSNGGILLRGDVGLSYVVGPGRLQLELDFTRANPSDDAKTQLQTNRAAVTGNYLGLEGALGYVFSF